MTYGQKVCLSYSINRTPKPAMNRAVLVVDKPERRAHMQEQSSGVMKLGSKKERRGLNNADLDLGHDQCLESASKAVINSLQTGPEFPNLLFDSRLQDEVC